MFLSILEHIPARNVLFGVVSINPVSHFFRDGSIGPQRAAGISSAPPTVCVIFAMRREGGRRCCN